MVASREIERALNLGDRDQYLLQVRCDLQAELDQVEDELWSFGWKGLARTPGESSPVPEGVGEPAGGALESSRPVVIREANIQALVGLDWLRCTGSVEALKGVIAILEDHFGAADPQPGRGMWYFEKTMRFAGGLVFIAHSSEAGRNSGWIGVEVPGSALGKLDGDERIMLMAELRAVGLKCTRVDVSVDLLDEKHRAGSVDLVGQVWAAYERGELCGSKSAKRYLGGRFVKGASVPTGDTVYIGQRGKNGSGRFTRVYDKGLEQKFPVANFWHRWEVEFTDEVADMVGARLSASCSWGEDAGGSCVVGKEWVLDASCFALGAVDFKRVTGAVQACRRPRAGWWQDVVSFVCGSSDPERLKAKRGRSSLEGYCVHVAESVIPRLQGMADSAGWTVGETIEFIQRKWPTTRRAVYGPVMWEWERWLDRRSGFDVGEGGADTFLAAKRPEGEQVAFNSNKPIDGAMSAQERTKWMWANTQNRLRAERADSVEFNRALVEAVGDLPGSRIGDAFYQEVPEPGPVPAALVPQPGKHAATLRELEGGVL